MTGFAKTHHNYGAWTKGRFSEAVTVTGPGTLIFLAGIGAEDAETGELRHPGDFEAQCRYAYDKLRAVLAKHDATLADAVRQTTYITDVRHAREAAAIRMEQYAGLTLPAHTSLTVVALAWPGMLVEIEVTAALAR